MENSREGFLLSKEEIGTPHGELEDLENEARHELLESKWGDERFCSYEQGAKTQNVYLCSTCSDKSGVPVAVCFACSMKCHLEHNIVELFLKRDIRCDCGTGGLPACGAREESAHVDGRNAENVYEPSHNYRGVFCWCQRPYEPEEGVMLQCVRCTDWYHTKCIAENNGGNVEFAPDDEEVFDMTMLVCKNCMTPELDAYVPLLRFRFDLEEQSEIVPVESCPPLRPNYEPRSVFFTHGFTELLCHCEACTNRFTNKFLQYEEGSDEEDAVDGQIDQPLAVGTTLEDALQAMPHDKAIRMASGFNRFKEIAQEVIARKYQEGKRVIDDDDVQDIIGQVFGQKKQKQ